MEDYIGPSSGEPPVPLPPTEHMLAILLTVAMVGNHRAAAGVLGISESTLRNQLGDVYIRLGAVGGMHALWKLMESDPDCESCVEKWKNIAQK